MLHYDYKTLGHLLNDAAANLIKLLKVLKLEAPAQEVMHLAIDDGLDIRKLMPAPINPGSAKK